MFLSFRAVSCLYSGILIRQIGLLAINVCQVFWLILSLGICIFLGSRFGPWPAPGTSIEGHISNPSTSTTLIDTKKSNPWIASSSCIELNFVYGTSQMCYLQGTVATVSSALHVDWYASPCAFMGGMELESCLVMLLQMRLNYGNDYLNSSNFKSVIFHTVISILWIYFYFHVNNGSVCRQNIWCGCRSFPAFFITKLLIIH